MRVSGLKLPWLFLAVLLPGLIGLVAGAVASYQRAHEDLDQHVLQTARALSQAVDREMFGAQNALQGLAISSRTIDRRDFAGFYRDAREMLDRTGIADAIGVTDESGQQVVNTLVPFGTPLPHTNNLARLRTLFASGRPYISDLLLGTVAKRYLITVDVPVVRDGKVRYALNAAMLSERLKRILQAQDLPNDWIAIIYDRNGVIAARTRDPEKYVGRKAAAPLTEPLAIAREGTLEAVTLEGIPVTVAYSRSPTTEYSVAIGVPLAVLNADLRKGLAPTLVAVAAIMLASLLLAWRFGGQLLDSLRQLSSAVDSAATGHIDLTLPTKGPAEVVQLARQFENMLEVRRQAESAIKVEQQRLYGVLEMLPAFVLLLTQDYRVRFANRFYRDRFGDPGDRPCFEFLRSRSAPCDDCEMYLLAGGKSEHQWEWTGPDHHSYAIYARRLPDIEGGPLMLEMGIDVTERRLAEQHQGRMFRAMRLLSDCNITLAQTRDEQALCREICRVVVGRGGYRMAWIGVAEHDEAKSVRPVAQAGHEDGYLASIRISWDEAQPSGRGPTGTAIRTGAIQVNQNVLTNPKFTPWREAAMRRGYQSSIALPLVSGERALGALTIYSGDPEAFNAEEVALLEELAGNLALGLDTLRTRAERDSAEAATRAKSQFLANVSHEIRTPMNAILGMVHLLRRDGVSPKQAERLDKVDLAADHLLSIINDVLDLSKIEAGKLVLEDVDISINSIMANIVSILSPRATAKGLHLLLDAEHLPRRLRGDPTRLTQALLNYANNAIKFTEQGTITLRTRLLEETDDAKLVRFEVQDTGIGVAPETLARLFAPFEQADSSTTREYGGSGLGLVITRRLAQLMGGEAGAFSTPGAGSTFWFTARLRKAAPVMAASLTPAAAAAMLTDEHRGRRLLLAEDEPINREVTLELLSDTGLDIDVAEDGAEAVAMAQRTAYDLILMDMQMPKIDGVEAVRRIRAMPGHEKTPIVAMTANAFAEDRRKCMDAGMDDFLAKPVAPAALYGALAKWLRPR
jgi:signal transduction histidine kinase/ActR/RegA family two-component response regulator/PAS domain-containing protein